MFGPLRVDRSLPVRSAGIYEDEEHLRGHWWLHGRPQGAERASGPERPRTTAVDPRWFALFAVGKPRSAPRGRPRSRRWPRKCSVSSVTPTKRTSSDRSTRSDRTSANKLLRAQFRAVSRRKHLQIIVGAPSRGTEASSDSQHICDDFVASVPEVWSWNQLGARVLGKVAQRRPRGAFSPAPTDEAISL